MEDEGKLDTRTRKRLRAIGRDKTRKIIYVGNKMKYRTVRDKNIHVVDDISISNETKLRCTEDAFIVFRDDTCSWINDVNDTVNTIREDDHDIIDVTDTRESIYVTYESNMGDVVVNEYDSKNGNNVLQSEYKKPRDMTLDRMWIQRSGDSLKFVWSARISDGSNDRFVLVTPDDSNRIHVIFEADTRRSDVLGIYLRPDKRSFVTVRREGFELHRYRYMCRRMMVSKSIREYVNFDSVCTHYESFKFDIYEHHAIVNDWAPHDDQYYRRFCFITHDHVHSYDMNDVVETDRFYWKYDISKDENTTNAIMRSYDVRSHVDHVLDVSCESDDCVDVRDDVRHADVNWNIKCRREFDDRAMKNDRLSMFEDDTSIHRCNRVLFKKRNEGSSIFLIYCGRYLVSIANVSCKQIDKTKTYMLDIDPNAEDFVVCDDRYLRYSMDTLRSHCSVSNQKIKRKGILVKGLKIYADINSPTSFFDANKNEEFLQMNTPVSFSDTVKPYERPCKMKKTNHPSNLSYLSAIGDYMYDNKLHFKLETYSDDEEIVNGYDVQTLTLLVSKALGKSRFDVFVSDLSAGISSLYSEFEKFVHKFALQLTQPSQWKQRNWIGQSCYTFTGKCVPILDSTSNPSQRLEELDDTIKDIQSKLESDRERTLKLAMNEDNRLLFFASKENMQKSLADLVVTRSIIELLQLYAGVRIVFIDCTHVDGNIRIDIDRGDPSFSTLQYEWNDVIQGRARDRNQSSRNIPIIYMTRYTQIVPQYHILKWSGNNKIGYLFESDFLRDANGNKEYDIVISSRDGIHKKRLT
jgi:hypothetical protein